MLNQSVSQLAQAIRDKEISSTELVTACIERIESVNPSLNAVVQLVADSALVAAREADDALMRGERKGPLHGIPMTIKDSFDTAGVISTGGTLGRKDYVPQTDATVVARLKDAGAILLGKTNTPELTLSTETDNLIYGRTSNPYDLSRSSGGSSGGAAAIVVTGGSPFDIGSDYGGSIRIPAHCCGITGIKPTSGRVPRTGHIIPYGAGAVDAFQQIGPLARYVEDLALILPIIAGIDWRDPAIVPMPNGDPNDVDVSTLRVAVHTDNGFITPTPETIQAVQSAAKLLADTGAVVEEARPPEIETAFDIHMELGRGDGRAWIQRLLDQYGTTQAGPNLTRFDTSNALPVAEYSALVARWDAFRSKMLTFMKDYDVILCPVNAYPAVLHGTGLEAQIFKGISYTAAYNLTGWPAATVRGGTSPEGLPIGVQVVARPWREDVALAVAQQLETAFGGWPSPPL